ncbi:UBX domain-containing protein [Mycotypha africana]|uniref:UBX domain-containing protein n=1 Tax=Mycotypha africana TaxID=64632 RepID=UPI00230011F9|nr:UBX domain-containing protein [Mycotypha africana]KAI8979049.1 UBX domain-containing protein [Mycotypha africana]
MKNSTHIYCIMSRNVLNSPQLIDFVKGNNILVWAGDVRESEAHKVSSTLQAATFPFMALIALQQPRVGSSSAAPKMGVLARIEGCQQYNNVELLIQQLESTMDRHGAVINRLRHERKQREMERQLLSDQDKAYRKSLKADQEKARKAKEEKERQERSERERLEKEKQKELLEKKRQQYIRYLYTHLPVEPTENVARISFRLADGARVVRKFAKTDTLESLYQFVEAYPLIKEAESIEEEKSKPDNYKHQYKFKIVSPYPRMEYEPDDTKEIHTVSSLWPSATLVVDAADEDEDVDENNEDNAIDTTTSVGNSV